MGEETPSMKTKEHQDLRELLIDAHAHFFFLKGEGVARVRLWQILPNSIIIDSPSGVPMRKTVLGYIPTLDGAGVYEVDGTINPEPLPDQTPGTIRIDIDSAHVRRVNRRLFPRHSFTPPLSATAQSDGDKKACPVRIINFSAGGLRIESERPVSAESEATFRFRIEIDDEVHDIKIKGSVVYEIPIDKGFAYGVKFILPEGKSGEAPVEALDQTVDLLGLVNRLIVRGG